MGKSYTPKYRVETRDNTAKPWAAPNARQAWLVKDYGRATDENLAAWVRVTNRSFKSGGVNFHVSVAAGVEVHINWARIVEQATGEVVAEYFMPMFEIA